MVYSSYRHGQTNDTWETVPWETMNEAPGKTTEGLLPQVPFVAGIVLGCDSMPAMKKFTFNL